MTLEEFCNLEFVLDAFKTSTPIGGMLTSNDLAMFLPILKDVEEFKGKNVTVTHIPNWIDENGVHTSHSMKFGELSVFKDDIQLYSISQTPEIYDNDMSKYIKESGEKGACITPLFFEAADMFPTKRVVLKFSPEELQDSTMRETNTIREDLHKLLDKVLDNPEEYRVKGTRGIIIRGVF